jgi:serine O-acetyltransferase
MIRLLNVALYGIDIAPGASFGPNLTIHHGVGLVVGPTTTAEANIELFQGVTLGGRSGRSVNGRYEPLLGNNVRIHAGAVVIGPVTLGDYVDVGANAVVLEDVPAFHVVGGNPSHTIRVKAPA